MKITLNENVKPSMPKTEDAKDFMKKIKEYSQSDINNKSIVSTLNFVRIILKLKKIIINLNV